MKDQNKQFEQWVYKYKQKKRDEFDRNRAEVGNDPDEVLREKRILVELEKRLDEENVPMKGSVYWWDKNLLGV